MTSSVRSSNASSWHQIAEFLEDQWLERLGLRRVQRTAGAPGREQAQRRALGAAVRALPVGNHGENNLTTGRAA